MADQELASRTFGLNDQVAFARLSSDWNPMHLNDAFARRSQMGAPVVHAILGQWSQYADRIPQAGAP